MAEAQPLYPLLFEPVLKDYIWGGRGLAERLGRQLPAGTPIAESWEIAAHMNGDVTIINGAFAGKSLSTLTSELGLSLLGTRAEWALRRGKFPLLVKLLDANRRLSVQVHPDDEYALEHEGNELGKSEMWVVLHAEPDSAVILGVRKGTDASRLRKALDKGDGSIERYLHRIPVSSGDFICVPSGSLHAILGGAIIAEIQQNSDMTYRVYDWERLGHDGKPRTLHVDKALEVISFAQVEPQLPEPLALTSDTAGIRRWELCRTSYFVVERVKLATDAEYEGATDGTSLEIWGCTSGQVALASSLSTVLLPEITFTLLPARLGPFQVAGVNGEPATLLRVYLPPT